MNSAGLIAADTEKNIFEIMRGHASAQMHANVYIRGHAYIHSLTHISQKTHIESQPKNYILSFILTRTMVKVILRFIQQMLV